MTSDTKFKRKFQPDLPAFLLEGMTTKERWMFEQQSIQRQQNEAILERLDEGEKRFDQAEKDRDEMKREIKSVATRVEVFERFKERLSAKWTVIAFIACAIIGPLALALIGGVFSRAIEKLWK